MSAATQSQPLVAFTIDGRAVTAPEGSYVLEAATRAGIEIPTLCNHPDLEPVGACRICMVEVTHPDWNGWSGLMTSCLYPVKEGIQVSTRSDRVKAARRGVLSLLVARCPESKTIRALAEQYDARADGLTTDPEADNCILCGLCTRVCETYATAAITTAGRGAIKRVTTFADQQPEECVGCGACVSVCPTAELVGERSDTGYNVWNRFVPTSICVVDEARCVGCGSCEEACPFSVARVAFRFGGTRTAVIPADACRGCGACVGACPSGAIEQRDFESAKVSPATATSNGTIQVFACGRSNLRKVDDPSLHITELPCAGRVTVPMLLHAIASGAQGAIVLGRHQRTCRFDGAEDPVRDRVEAARDVLDLVGIDRARIAFDEPAPGPQGPRESIQAFQSTIASMPPHPVRLRDALEHDGLDVAMAWIERMLEHASLSATGSRFFRTTGLPTAAHGQPVLLGGSTAAMHVLGRKLFDPVRLDGVLRAALNVLEALGVQGVGVALARKSVAGACYALEPTTLAEAISVDDLLRARGKELPRAPRGSRIAIDGSESQRQLALALGYEPVDVGPDPLPNLFTFPPAARIEAEARLVAAERQGAAALLVDNPRALARWAMITRVGAWRESRVRPVLGVHLADMAIRQETLARTRFDATAAEVPS